MAKTKNQNIERIEKNIGKERKRERHTHRQREALIQSANLACVSGCFSSSFEYRM